jgi:hypothetical protein
VCNGGWGMRVEFAKREDARAEFETFSSSLVVVVVCYVA